MNVGLGWGVAGPNVSLYPFHFSHFSCVQLSATHGEPIYFEFLLKGLSPLIHTNAPEDTYLTLQVFIIL